MCGLSHMAAAGAAFTFCPPALSQTGVRVCSINQVCGLSHVAAAGAAFTSCPPALSQTGVRVWSLNQVCGLSHVAAAGAAFTFCPPAHKPNQSCVSYGTAPSAGAGGHHLLVRGHQTASQNPLRHRHTPSTTCLR